MEWQPIETAPKDGEKIMITRPEWRLAIEARWMEYPGNPVLDADGGDVWMSGWGHDCGWFDGGIEEYWLGWTEDKMPTHWMPLPEPPK